MYSRIATQLGRFLEKGLASAIINQDAIDAE